MALAHFCLVASATELPTLSISNQPSEILLSWPRTSLFWVLEQATDLAGQQAWTAVSPAHYQSLATIRYSLKPTHEASFFRLRRIDAAPSTLTGYWPLEHGEGNRSPDEGARGKALEYSGTTPASGRFGQAALRFNGGSGLLGSRAWVSNTSFQVLPPDRQPFSISLWFNPDATNAGRQTLVGSGSTSSNGWIARLERDGPGRAAIVFSSLNVGPSLSITGKSVILPSRWHQLTLTYGTGQIGSLYLDSALIAQGRLDIRSQEGPLYFGGGMLDHESFTGAMDEIRTYAHCLSDDEISLSGHWRFNEGAGTLALDGSIHGRHAGVMDAGAWTQGREGTGIDLNCGAVTIQNDDYSVLPASGGAFSISLRIRPSSLTGGRRELMACGDATNGWELLVRGAVDETWLELSSTNKGGTLAIETPLPLTNGIWTALDITYNGGVAKIYVNGRCVGTGSGAIRGPTGRIVLGSKEGTSMDGTIDDLKIYSRERGPSEIGPVAETMWETVLIGTTTNIVLQGFGPPNKPLTFHLAATHIPTNGILVHLPGSSTVTYQANGTKGPDAFAYTVSDGEFTSPPAIVALSVVQPHWLSPQGGSELPLTGDSPSRAWPVQNAASLDAIWRTNAYYDCFFYSPGIFETTGWRFPDRITAHSGCKHVGSGSSGSGATELRLVEALEDINEGLIFGGPHEGADGFEARDMLLNCNGTNLPKFLRGAPVRIQIPLEGTGFVQNVALHWARFSVPSRVSLEFGPASQFTICSRRLGTNTSCWTVASTGAVDVVTLNAEADELWIDLQERAHGIDFYSLLEVIVPGRTVSLPKATGPDGGPSQLDPDNSALSLADGDPGSAWAAALDNHVIINLPLAQGSVCSSIELEWNCKTIEGIGRFGAAAELRILARDETTGTFHEVPTLRQGRAPSGSETIFFGTGSLVHVSTDHLVVELMDKELGIDFYSLREVRLKNGAALVPVRMPTARSTFGSVGYYRALNAFDDSLFTAWASHGPGMVGAASLFGNNLKFKNLKIIGFGTRATYECFPISLSPPYRASQYNVGNILIEDCIFTNPASRNRDGLTTVTLTAPAPSTVTNATARRCSVLNVRPEFVYSGGFTAVHVEHCRVENCETGVYFEQWGPFGENMSANILSNEFINVDYGIHILFHSATKFGELNCQGNEIVMDGSRGFGIAACDVCSPGPNGRIAKLAALNNIVRHPNWLPRTPETHGGILYTDIPHSVIGNNVLALGDSHGLRVRQCPAGIIYPPPYIEDCDYLPPPPGGSITYPPCVDTLPLGYRRAWFNNRNPSGHLMEVRTARTGVEGPALEQQWTD
jgi:hypothetical protein